MKQVSKTSVLSRLREENPWWASGEVGSQYSSLTPRPYRERFFPLIADRRVRRAVVLMGPRRVGKTVLLHHCIAQLLAGGVAGSRIGYVSVDNPLYVGLSIHELLELYAEGTGTDLQTEDCFFVLDEIQYLKGWEVHLKSLVDSQPRVRFVASGSAAAELRLKSLESGAGRFTDFLLPPLTFHEYLTLLDETELIEAANEALANRPLPEEEIEEINGRFVDYLNFGGYPELALSDAVQRDPGRYIKSDIVDKVLLRDLPSLYGIRDIQELNALFTMLAFNTAEEVSLDGLSKKAGVSKPTLKRYIEYLEAAFLIRVVHRVDRDARRFQRANFFKVYLTNPAMRTALFSYVDADGEAIGHLVETAVFAQWLHGEHRLSLHYARWERGSSEVDLVSLGPDQRKLWAVEVKWSDRHARDPRRVASAIDFCARNGIGDLTVTTRTARRDVRRSNVDVRFMPAALYCYRVGRELVYGPLDREQPSLFETGRLDPSLPDGKEDADRSSGD